MKGIFVKHFVKNADAIIGRHGKQAFLEKLIKHSDRPDKIARILKDKNLGTKSMLGRNHVKGKENLNKGAKNISNHIRGGR